MPQVQPMMDSDLNEGALASGKILSAWVRKESIRYRSEVLAMTGTDLVRLVADVNSQQVPAMLENEERKAGTLSASEPMQGRYPHGTMTLVHYIKPSDSNLPTTDQYPEGSILLEAVFGAKKIVDAGTARNITAVDATSGRALTKVTLAAGTFVVGDGVALRCHANSGTKSGPADNEIRRVTEVAGGPIVTCRPGFSRLPQAGASPDQLQGGVTYYLSQFVEDAYTVLTLDNRTSWQHTGSAVEDVQLSIDGENILQASHNVGFLRRIQTVTESVMGDGSTDVLGGATLTAKVADSRGYEVGSVVNLRYATAASSWLTITEELKVVLDAVNHTTKIVTLRSRTGTVVATNLVADSASVDVVAATYDTSTKTILRLRIDNREEVDITLTSGAATPIATIITDINTFLKNNQYYGYNVEGNRSVDWTAVASNVGGAVRLTSSMWGKESRIQIITTGLATSAHDAIFTGVLDSSANACWLEPWTPAETETGKPVLNADGWFNVDGYNFGVLKFDLTVKIPVVWLEVEKANTRYATGFIVSGTRTVEAGFEAYLRGKDGAAWKDSNDQTTHEGAIQCGMAKGRSCAVFLPKFRFFELAQSGDEPRTIAGKIRAYAQGTADFEKEVSLSFN